MIELLLLRTQAKMYVHALQRGNPPFPRTYHINLHTKSNMQTDREHDGPNES